MEPLEPCSFDSLYQDTYPRIYRHVYGLVRQREDAEDLTQDVYLKAYRARATMPTVREQCVRWLYRIATNTAIDALRRKRVLSWCPLEEAPPLEAESQTNPEAVALAREGREEIKAALACLPPSYRDALVFRFAGYSLPQIAERVHIAPGGAKMHLSCARAQFHLSYRKEEHV